MDGSFAPVFAPLNALRQRSFVLVCSLPALGLGQVRGLHLANCISQGSRAHLRDHLVLRAKLFRVYHPVCAPGLSLLSESDATDGSRPSTERLSQSQSCQRTL